MKNRVIAGVLAGILLLSAACSGEVFAAPEETQNPCGRIQCKEIELPASEESFLSALEEYSDTSQKVTVSEKRKGSQIYRSSSVWGDYEKYNTYYYYNRLNDSEKVVWDGLDEVCLGILNGSSDIGSFYSEEEGVNIYYSARGAAIPSNYNGQSISDLYQLFLYSNPQYYFLQVGCATGNIGGNYYAFPVIYGDFVDVTARNAATATLKNKLDGILAQTPAGSVETKAKYVFDYMVANITYNETFLQNNSYAMEEQYKTQSMYSAAILGTTVCAGYTQMYQALCNALGIDAIAVTSVDHAWNMMRVGGAWVYVDVTWGDAGVTPDYSYFERNESYMLSDESHIPESICAVYLDSAIYDSGDGYVLSSYPLNVAAVPYVSSYSFSGDKVICQISGASQGGRFYYVTDTTTPAVAQTKSIQIANGGSISLSEGQVVYLMQYCPNMLDSSVYTISYSDFSAELSKPAVSLTNTKNGVAISWNNVENASGYQVQKKEGGSYKTIKNLGNGTTSYTDKTVKGKNGSRYNYRVIAVGSGFYQSVASNEQTIYRLTDSKFTTAKNVSPLSLQLAWKKNKKATGYQIKYVVGSKTKTVKITKNKTLKKTIKKLKKNKTYKVYIRSYKKNSSGTYYSAWSSVKKVKIKK